VVNEDAAAAFGAPEEKPRPSAAGYVIAGLLAVAAIGGAIAWVVLGFVNFSDSVDALKRVPVGGARMVSLDSGRQGIYYEGPGGEKAVVPPLRIVVVPAGGGTPVPVGGYSGSVTYSMDGHAGRSVAGIGIDQAGRYRVAVAGNASPGAVVAIGPGLGHKIVRALVGGVVIFVVGMLAAGLLIIATAYRRRRPA